jgi:hypothetical protein
MGAATLAATTFAVVPGESADTNGLHTSEPPSIGARTLSLSEDKHLHMTSHHSFTLNKQNSASGMISGKLAVPAIARRRVPAALAPKS